MKTDIKILQGHQIGGCITIISSNTTRIVIDFGESLPGAESNKNVDFDWDKEKIDAVFFTHYHGDHIGRINEIPSNIPIYMGKASFDIMMNIKNTLRLEDETQLLKDRNNIYFLETNVASIVGDIEVTPYSVDHSAFDAYMFLIHSKNEYILHTGDFRDHGHKGTRNGKSIILEVIDHYIRQNGKRDINALILEGTMMSRINERHYSEKDMLNNLTEEFKSNKYVFLKISSTNVDSLASFSKAAERNGMKMYVGQYLLKQIEIYRTIGAEHGTNMYNFSNVLPYLPCPDDCVSEKQISSSVIQRQHMRQDGFIIIVSEKGDYKKVIDEFCDLPTKTYYSMWKGYLIPESPAFNKELYNLCEYTHADTTFHTSGHAYPKLLEKVIEAVNPTDAIIPIHTEKAEEFLNLNISENLKNIICTNI